MTDGAVSVKFSYTIMPGIIYFLNAQCRFILRYHFLQVNIKDRITKCNKQLISFTDPVSCQPHCLPYTFPRLLHNKERLNIRVTLADVGLNLITEIADNEDELSATRCDKVIDDVRQNG